MISGIWKFNQISTLDDGGGAKNKTNKQLYFMNYSSSTAFFAFFKLRKKKKNEKKGIKFQISKSCDLIIWGQSDCKPIGKTPERWGS